MAHRALAVAVAAAAAACSSRGAAPTPPPQPTDAAPPVVATAPIDAGTADAATADAGASPCGPAATPTDRLTLVPAGFADLPGWADDHLAEAVPPLLASCDRLALLPDRAPIGVDGYSGPARAWRHVCAAARRVHPGDDRAARAFFEHELTPYLAEGKTGPDGKMTAYDVQSLRGSRTRHGPYQTPLYRRPRDLVSVDLSAFIPDGRGRHIWGRVDRRGDLVRYPTRAQIKGGALDNKHLEILWVDDPVDALFAQIEGSGVVTLDDGSTVWIEFAGKNGRAYRGVGGVLRGSGALARGQGTMQGIRRWFAQHPDRFDEIADQDASFVFFKISARPGAVGSEHVILTAKRSAAVDRAFVAHATPLWIDTRAPVPGRHATAPWRHLVIAQDTGGGIRGPVRADLYWCDDEAAAEVAGRLGGRGRYWLLLPRGLHVSSPPLAPPPAP
jgi:peptidoglycan lytic transglycosylase A